MRHRISGKPNSAHENQESVCRKKSAAVRRLLSFLLSASMVFSLPVSSWNVLPVQAEETDGSEKPAYKLVEVVPDESEAVLGLMLPEVTGEVSDGKKLDTNADGLDVSAGTAAESLYYHLQDAVYDSFYAKPELTAEILDKDTKFKASLDKAVSDYRSTLEEYEDALAEAENASGSDLSEEDETDLAGGISDDTDETVTEIEYPELPEPYELTATVTIPLSLSDTAPADWIYESSLDSSEKGSASRILSKAAPYLLFSDSADDAAIRQLFRISGLTMNVTCTIYPKEETSDDFVPCDGTGGISYETDYDSIKASVRSTDLLRRFVLTNLESGRAVNYTAVTPSGLNTGLAANADWLFFGGQDLLDYSSESGDSASLQDLYNAIDYGTVKKASYDSGNDITWGTALSVYNRTVSTRNALAVTVPETLWSSSGVSTSSNLWKLSRMLFYFQDASAFRNLFDTGRFTDTKDYIVSGTRQGGSRTGSAGDIVTDGTASGSWPESEEIFRTSITDPKAQTWKNFARYLRAGDGSRYPTNGWDLSGLFQGGNDLWISRNPDAGASGGGSDGTASEQAGNLLAYKVLGSDLAAANDATGNGFYQALRLAVQSKRGTLSSDTSYRVAFRSVSHLAHSVKDELRYTYWFSEFSGRAGSNSSLLKTKAVLDLPFKVDGYKGDAPDQKEAVEAVTGSLTVTGVTGAEIRSGSDGYLHLQIPYSSLSADNATLSITAGTGETTTVVFRKLSFFTLH